MNNSTYQQPETLINIKEIIWDVLEQWKAALIAALLMALLACGAKYAKDMRSYNAREAAEASKAETNISTEERIAAILEGLPEDGRATVEFMIEQNEWIETEKDYINNSILMNTNPTAQRTLTLTYYVEATSEAGDVAQSCGQPETSAWCRY